MVVTRSVDAEDDEVGASVVVVVVVTVRLAARGEDAEVDVSELAQTPVDGISVALRLVPCTAVVDEFEVEEDEDEEDDEEEVEEDVDEEDVEEAVAAGWCWALRNTSCSCCVRR